MQYGNRSKIYIMGENKLMQKMKTRVFTGVLAASLAMGTAFPYAVLASDSTVPAQTLTPVDRLYGETRYETAAQIASQGWKKGDTDTAILAPGMDENLVDALTAAPLAKSLNAPILLTEGTQIPAATVKVLEDLGIKKVYTVSGVIGKGVKDQLANINDGIEVVKELGGVDRFETATNIAKELKDVTGVMMTTAYTYADALSVASIAASKNMPILLADGDTIPTVEATYLDGIKDQVKESYVLGGQTVVGSDVYDSLPGTVKDRIAGSDRFETNRDVLEKFTDLKYDKVYVANGQDEHLVDALVAAPLAAQTNSPIVLADTTLTADTEAFIQPKMTGNNLIALGGNTVVKDDVLSYNHVLPQDFGVMTISDVNGYSVGFALNGLKLSDVNKIQVSLFKGNTLLATNTSTNQLFASYPDATQLSTPFNIDGNFANDGFWNYGAWNGTVLDVPTKAVIQVTTENNQVYTVVNSNLTGDTATLNAEAAKHVKTEDFGVMQSSGVNGYSVGFSLADGKKAYDVKNIKVELYKTTDNGDVLLATNTSTDKLLRLDASQLSSPFNINGTFDGVSDGYWNYGQFNGTVEDVPSKVVIEVTYNDGKTYTVQNTNLTGDSELLGAPALTTDLSDKATTGVSNDFTVSTAPNSYVSNLEADKQPVKVKVTLTSGSKDDIALQYKEGEEYKDLTLDENGVAFFGPETGFPFAAATSDFKVAFNKAGIYTYKLEVVTVTADEKDSKVLASYDGQVVVTDPAAN